jgi:membrane protease YdiL (CAAX protease family)
MPSIPPPELERGPAADSSGPGEEGAAPPWRLWMAPAAVLLGLVLGQVAVIIVNAVGQAAGGSSFAHPSPAVSIIGDVVADLAFVAAAIYLAAIQRHARPQAFGFRRTRTSRAVGWVLAGGASYYLLTLVYAAIFNLHGKDKLPSELGVNHSTAALVGAAVFVCVIAPMAEEFFFRGFLFGVLRRWRIVLFGRDVGTLMAAIVVGVLFGLAHTGSASPEYLVPLGFLGFVLCLIRWRTGSLYPCMALHSFNNSLALGVNQLHWSAGAILGLIVGSLLVIAAVTAPLARTARPAV